MSEKKPQNFNVDELKSNLLDTSKTLDNVMNELYGVGSSVLTAEDYKSISSDLFCCTECYFWCERSEESEGGKRICLDCVEDEN